MCDAVRGFELRVERASGKLGARDQARAMVRLATAPAPLPRVGAAHTPRADVAACRRNVEAFWPAMRDLPIEVRDGTGRLVTTVPTEPAPALGHCSAPVKTSEDYKKSDL